MTAASMSACTRAANFDDPPARTFTAVRAIAPVAGMPPNSRPASGAGEEATGDSHCDGERPDTGVDREVGCRVVGDLPDLRAVRMRDAERGRYLLESDHHGDARSEPFDHGDRQVAHEAAE